MAKVLGLGGIFFKSKDPKELGQWYQQWLGLNIDSSYGGTIFDHQPTIAGSYTVWSPFKADTNYFEPSKKEFMINFIVDNLDEALEQVKKGGAAVHGKSEEEQFGLFGWFSDPEGNKVELWQPNELLSDDEQE